MTVIAMPRFPLKNLHVPLPEPLHRRLRAEAERAQRPVTALAREAIDCWLAEQQRRLVHEAIQAYALGAGGTADDLDGPLEAAAVEHLRDVGHRKKPAK